MQLPLTKDQINAFLYYGYVPRPNQVKVQRLLSRYGIDLQEIKSQKPREELIREGAKILDDTFHDIAGKVGKETVVIPLSGGMDSRAILAGMLKHLPKSQIQTVTVGIPGALDYEIGQQVAKKVGVVNKVINLGKIKWSEQELIGYAKKFHYPIALVEGFLFSQVFSCFEGGSVFLSGFMGDPLSGSHLQKNDSVTWEKAKIGFIKRNNYTENQSSWPENELLPEKPFLDRKLITLDEQLDFFIRQRLYIMPLVLLKDKKHIAPFLNPRWVVFMLNLPRSLRKDQMLYKKILFNAYPELFSLPLKNTGGLPLNVSTVQFFLKRITNRIGYTGRKYLPFVFSGSAQGLNYIDFELSYRKKDDLKAFAQKSLDDLQYRGLVKEINIPIIWQEHQTGQANHSQLISLLVSLEIYFKAAKGYK